MRGRIAGTGSYLPERKITNQDLEERMDTTDEWIRERTGIRERHIAGNETVAFMAAKAGTRALENAGIRPEDVGLILVASSTGDTVFPNMACTVQKAIGAVHAACLDVSAACAGFLAIYQMGQLYLETERVKCALLIGADAMSRLVDWKDRGTCILFGDGAGAAVLVPDENAKGLEVLHSEGIKGDSLICAGKILLARQNHPYLSMDGRAVFQFALSRVPEVIEEVLQKSGQQKEEISWYILHQANSRILSGVARRLHVPEEKFPSNIASCGNTCAASIPILLDECNRKGLFARGDQIILSGFGAGLTWGAACLTWE